MFDDAIERMQIITLTSTNTQKQVMKFQATINLHLKHWKTDDEKHKRINDWYP